MLIMNKIAAVLFSYYSALFVLFTQKRKKVRKKILVRKTVRYFSELNTLIYNVYYSLCRTVVLLHDFFTGYDRPARVIY